MDQGMAASGPAGRPDARRGIPVNTPSINMAASAPRPSTGSAYLLALFELTKPRVATLVIFSVAAGAGLAWQTRPELGSWAMLVNAVIGTSLVAAGASVLNMVLEKASDALMVRTRTRPLPTGRVGLGVSTAFGVILSVAGLGYLMVSSRGWVASFAALLTLFGYVLVYTPLKRVSAVNTLVGAVPGAMPPVLGYLAITGEWDATAWLLFAILFVWQIPHFLSIAWMYRNQYEAAGLRMITVNDPSGGRTSRQMVLYCLALLVVSSLPAVLLPPNLRPGPLFLGASLLAGGIFLRSAIRFAFQPTDQRARFALRASLLHLPLVLGAWLLDPLLRARPDQQPAVITLEESR
jgi:protoheme IX farnesyltransferase